MCTSHFFQTDAYSAMLQDCLHRSLFTFLPGGGEPSDGDPAPSPVSGYLYWEEGRPRALIFRRTHRAGWRNGIARSWAWFR